MIARLLLFIALSATLYARAAETVPLPALGTDPLRLRVAHVVNPRLPRMTPQQLELLLDSARKTVKSHFGRDLVFGAVDEIPIGQAFSGIEPGQAKTVDPLIFDFKTGTGDVPRFKREFVKGLPQSGQSAQDMLKFAAPYLPGRNPQPTFQSLGEVLAEAALERLGQWRNLPALDGKPAIDAPPYNEFLYWANLGRWRSLPYELVLTNQIIASLEYAFPAVHAALRGGYTNGVTTPDRRTKYQTVSVWSTFAFTSNDAWFLKLRNGERYSDAEAARLAGVGAAHEIGHQLFHFLDAYGQEGCLMNPVPLFAYREWADSRSPSKCPINSSAAMKIGAYKFRY